MSYVKSRKSACASAEYFIPVDTNEHGALEIHRCKHGNCGGTFVFSVADDCWVVVTDLLLRDRLQAAIDFAAKDGTSGFHANHKI